jgi:hypothetical protein
MGEPSYTLREFCQLERCSRAFVYLQWKKGEGPDFYYAGSSIRITEAARRKWQQRHAAKHPRKKFKTAAEANLGV